MGGVLFIDEAYSLVDGRVLRKSTANTEFSFNDTFLKKS